MFFLGEYTHAIDDKGRLTVPVKYRDAFVEGAVVTRGYDRNLSLYTSSVFDQIAAKARGFSPTVPQNRELMRMLFAGASSSRLDKTGRIAIPGYLREYAGLDGEVVIAGVGGHLEVWSQAGWVEQLHALNDPEANARRFGALDLATG